MATANNRLVPARAIHPGEILREELQERGIKQKEFAQMIGVQEAYLNEFVEGKRTMDEALATKLEEHLGIPYKTWMNLHKGYLLDNESFIPSVSFHPGTTLAEKVEELGMSVEEFASHSGLPINTVKEVIKGKLSVTEDLAAAFEKMTKIPARFWLQKQNIFHSTTL